MGGSKNRRYKGNAERQSGVQPPHSIRHGAHRLPFRKAQGEKTTATKARTARHEAACAVGLGRAGLKTRPYGDQRWLTCAPNASFLRQD